MSKTFDVADAPGTALQIRELTRSTLSELIGRDFIMHRVRAADAIFDYCDVARIEIGHKNGTLSLHLVVERNNSKSYEVPLQVVAHVGHDCWLDGTDSEGRHIVVFLKTDGMSPNNEPCMRIRVLVFPIGDTRDRPDQYIYTEATSKPPEPLEPACDQGSLNEEDEESEGYFER